MTDIRVANAAATANSILGLLEGWGDQPIPPEGVRFLFTQLAESVRALADSIAEETR